MDGWMNGRMDGWMGGWVGGWVGGWMDGYNDSVSLCLPSFAAYHLFTTMLLQCFLVKRTACTTA